MTVLVELFFPEGTTEQHDRLLRQAPFGEGGSSAPEGMLSHAAVVTEDGLRFVELWDSERAFQAFFARLGNAMEEIGVSSPEPPTVNAVHHVLVPGHTPAAVTPPALPLDFPIRHG